MTSSRPATLALVLSAAALTELGAQGTTATVRVNLPVTDAVSVLQVSSSSADFGTVGLSQLDAGVVSTSGPTLHVRSNRPFAVSIAAAAATFGPAAKPASHVQWAMSAGGPFNALGTSPATVLSSGSGAVVQQPLYFRMSVSLGGDPPGSYQLSLTFTLTAP